MRFGVADDYRKWFLHEETSKPAFWIQTAFSVAAFLWPLVRYLQIRGGNKDLLFDAGTVWQPLATHVLHGSRLYADIPDNKPPLFQFINIAAEWTGDYALVLLTLVGISNAVIVWLAGSHFHRTGRQTVAILATVSCFLVLGPLGSIVNNKSLGTALLLSATALTSPLAIGVLIGAAIGIAQQVIIGVPAVVWYQARRGNWTWNDTMTTAFIASVVVASQYLVVWAVWGWESLTVGLQQTVSVAGEYTTATSQFQTTGGLLSMPGVWLRRVAEVLQSHELVFVIAVIGLISILATWRKRSLEDRFWAVYLLTLTPILGVRAYRHYWILIVAGIGACFAIGIDSLSDTFRDGDVN
jgi:hypothetical protein